MASASAKCTPKARSPLFEIRESKRVTGQLGVFSKSNFKIGDLLIDWSDTYEQCQQSNRSCDIGNKCYKYSYLELGYVNYCCDANIRHDFKTMKTFAIKDIKKGDEIFRNYNVNSWELSTKFFCNCPTDKCVKYAAGLNYYPIDKLQFILPYLETNCRNKLKMHLKQVLAKL